MYAITLLAQEGQGGGTGGMLQLLMPFLLIGVLFWFLLIRPARRQERERKAMIAALRKNDKVIAAGGLIGTVAIIKENEDEVTLKVDDNTRIRVLRSSIVKVFREESSEGKETKDKESS